MSESLSQTYKALYDEVLLKVAELLEKHLQDHLDGVERVDRVVARAKSPDRFLDKAKKVNGGGKPKYSNPLIQIQDQIGARVTVLYLSDVPHVKEAINAYFHSIEWQEKKPESDAEFGYFGEHYILNMPDDAIPDGLEERSPKFFELQIKTLFQHAWSECHHDIGYKTSRKLTSLEVRQMAFSAAQAWGADQIFLQLANDLTPDNDR